MNASDWPRPWSAAPVRASRWCRSRRTRFPGVGPDPKDIAANQFTYAEDPSGTRCPFGAHVRRANPRSGDLPEGTTGALARLLRLLGFKRASFYDDLLASARFHRIVRRGREYGTRLAPEDALQPEPEH